MTTLKQIVGPRTSLASSSLPTLASGTFCVSSAYNCTTNSPLDVIVEIDATTTNTVASPNQLAVYVQESLDGTNYRSGPTSGTTLFDQPNLRPLGTLPMYTTGATEIGTFSVAQALGYCPAYFKIVVLNQIGVSLTSGTLWTAEISATSA